EQDRATVRAAVIDVETGDDGPAEKIRKQQALCCGRLRHAKASFVAENGVATAFYHAEAFVLSDFVNIPG
ncbi:MAG: hypothetical protein LAO51_11140, partial [Acidobacteriia bacterium]|nr:hypothetical protein [Terriglobia bacterium]